MSRSRMFRAMLGPLLFITASVAAVVLAEGILRWRYAEPVRETTAEVAAIQSHLQLDPELGFTWKPSITEADDVRLTVRDVTFEPLTTDADGFKNTPAAIARLESGESPAVIGLGDSFMEHAHRTLFERFEDAGHFYLNRAIHRQTASQYNTILDRAANDLHPRVALYGLFENDFAEAEDFDHWRSSGLDWFTFHSGTWCGPSIETSLPKQFAKEQFRGFAGAMQALSNRVRGDRMTATGPSDDQVDLVADAASRTVSLAQDHGISLIFLFIPSRATAMNGDTLEAKAYDSVRAQLGEDAPTVVDLRPLFQNHPDPASLYYLDDAHWNANGMNLAADAILKTVLPLLQAGLHNES